MKLLHSAWALCALIAVGSVQGQEATIRKNLGARLPTLQKIDEVRKTPMPGLYEVRVNESEIYYTDAKGDFLLQGNLLDTRKRRNLTEEREAQLSAISFDSLPLKDALVVVRGNGKRKLAVFEDPNCGYCKRLERDMQKIDNITIYTFLIPILGADSLEKAKHIWCAKDKAQAWENWMLFEQKPEPAKCDTTALERNLAFSRQHKITGTPTLFFRDGTRIPGAISADDLEKRLAGAPS
jgi:thiol:disulfide interchange protein DsbC